MSSQYTEALNVCIPMRSCLYFLPQIMQRFSEVMPTVALNIKFHYDNNRIDLFLRKEHDILFAGNSELDRFSNIKTATLFDSRFYLITRHDDPLAKSEIITEHDLDGRTFIIGGDAPAKMVAIQQRILNRGQVEIVNSHDLSTAFAYVAAGRGVSLCPGFANDHNGEFAWIPFDCSEKMHCVLGFHKDDHRESTRLFIDVAQTAYAHAGIIPL